MTRKHTSHQEATISADLEPRPAVDDANARIGPANFGPDDSLREGPEPVDISDEVIDQDEPTSNERGVSVLWVHFGQFIDHELTLSPVSEDPLVIDGLVDDAGPGNLPELGRSEHTFVDGVRTPINAVTPYIDASPVYGSDVETEALLRTFEGGRLATSDGDLLPFDETGRLPEDVGGDAGFLAGDIRVGDNPNLTAIHTLFVREHNRVADAVARDMPGLSDQEIFQQARAHVEALIQKFVTADWLPKLLGEEALADYAGYRADVDPQVSVEFTTAAFRFGHSTVDPTIARLAEDGDVVEAGDLNLLEGFFDTTSVTDTGIAPILRGGAATGAQQLDHLVIDELREDFLDLPAVNIGRGRDHGLPTFVEVRAALEDRFDIELPDIETFADLSDDPGVQARLAAAYDDVADVDLWVGGLAETDREGAQIGDTFYHLIRDQFTRSRDGDPLWYENRLTADDLAQIRGTSFADLVRRNTDIDHLYRDVFESAERIGGGAGDDVLEGAADAELILGFAGQDRLLGRGGDDDLYGGADKDRLVAGAGADQLHGEAGDDLLVAGGGDDLLRGGKGDDMLVGGAGDDVLNGGEGDDHLIDLVGADDFRYGGGADSIVGFDVDEDTLTLTDAVIAGGGELRTRSDFAALAEDVDARATDFGGVVFEFGDGDRLTLLGTDDLLA